MRGLLLTAFLTCLLPHGIVCFEKFPGVTRTTCYLRGTTTSRPNSFVLARVNATFVKNMNSDNHNVICQIIDKNGSPHNAMALESALFGHSPQMISLQVADIFVGDIEGKTIRCQYRDISQRKDDASIETGTFICEGLSGLNIILTGMSSSTPQNRNSGLNSHRRRSVEVGVPISEIVCSNGILPPNFELTTTHKILGQVCTVRNDEYRCKVGRVWQFDSNGTLACLPCCTNYHWNNITKRCEACRPGYIQPLPNFWASCEPQRRYDPKQQATPPRATSTSSSSAEPVSTPVAETEIAVTKQQLIFQPPVLAPSNLKAIKIGLHSARIAWDPVSPSETQPVTKYKILMKSVTGNETRFVETEDREITIRALKSGKTYQAEVMAGNSKGFGLESTTLTFTMMHILRRPQGVEHTLTRNQLTITWNYMEALLIKDLKIVIRMKFTPQGKWWSSEIHKETVDPARGIIILAVPDFGVCDMEIYYSNDEETEGPIYKFHVTYKGITVPEVLLWILASAGIIVLLIIAVKILSSL